MPLAPGTRLGPYEILAPLGAGGMGEVYRARDRRLGREVALKVLPASIDANQERRARFEYEARAASGLTHPNIAAIYDVGLENDLHYIAMELVRGKTLGELIRGRRLPLSEALNYAAQIADALSAAHDTNIVHRDLKPGNIMVAESGLVKLVDFGLAKATQRSASTETETTRPLDPETSEGVLLGTVDYMSPEQAAGRPVDERSDIFSFGSVLYEMLTGRRPFSGGSTIETLAAILREEPPSVVSAGLPPEVDRLLRRCLRKDPARRFVHVGDLKIALEELREDAESGELAALAATPPRRRKMWMIAAGIAVLAAAVALIPIVSRLRGVDRSLPAVVPVRLTSDSGLTAAPSLSADGKFMAYASDRAGNGDTDIWVMQVPSGQPVRITQSKWDEYEPSISPDGTQIVYHSDQDGGGIYVIPALGGGQPRLLTPRGRSPRFSPDGSQILYRQPVANIIWNGPLYVIPVAGGAPRQIFSGKAFSVALWSADGGNILALAEDGVWLGPPDGGPAKKIPKPRDLPEFQSAVPVAWTSSTAGRQTIIAEGTRKNLHNIFRVPASADGTIGKMQQLTFGAESEDITPSVDLAGHLVYASGTGTNSIYVLPIDANQGRVTGSIQRLTRDTSGESQPVLSRDGEIMVFRRNNGTWLKRMDTGTDTFLNAWNGILSPDGSLVAYPSKGGCSVVPVQSGAAPRKLADDCGYIRSWSSDNRYVVSQTDVIPSVITVIDTASGQKTPVLQSAEYSLYSAQVSPDGRWIAFQSRTRATQERIFVAPFRESKPVPQEEWIPLTDGKDAANKPRWSPDSNLIYYTSNRGGPDGIWFQRMNTAKQPAGEPVFIQRVTPTFFSYIGKDRSSIELSVAADKLAFNQSDIHFNIWMLQLPD